VEERKAVKTVVRRIVDGKETVISSEGGAGQWAYSKCSVNRRGYAPYFYGSIFLRSI
jgi:hypothetical protein